MSTNSEIIKYAQEVMDDVIGQYVCGNTLLYDDDKFISAFDFILKQNILTDDIKLFGIFIKNQLLKEY